MLSPENNILIYGQGGLGKSTKLAQIAAHVWKKFGKRSRVYGADGGGFKAFKPLMDKEIVAYCPIDMWDEESMFYTLDLVTKGYWPEDVLTPNSTLLSPVKEWRECIKCKKDCGAKGLAMVEKCLSCGEKFGPGIRLPKKSELVNGMEEVGFIGFEGLTSFGNLLTNTLRKVDPTGGRSIKDGDTIISSLGQQHYGDAQTYIGQFVANTRALPVPIVAWTALELRGNDDGYGKPVFGPALPGKKLTPLCVPWFTDVLHLDGNVKMVGGQPVRDKDGLEIVERKLFLAKHYPADTKPYGFDAKTSAGMPLVIDDLLGQNTMTRFFEELEKAYERASEVLLG